MYDILDLDVFMDWTMVTKADYYKEKNLKRTIANWMSKTNDTPRWYSGGSDIWNCGQLLSIFQQYKVIYFYVRKECKSHLVESYPQLKNIQFYKVFDSYSAYQKIEQYLTNELADDPMSIDPISDKLKAENHGFNKWSFRKEPHT
jgi:hypothetical protein